MSTFEDMMKGYADSQQAEKKTEIKKYELSNYFSTFLQPNENSVTKEIRILPPKEGQNVFWDVLWGHKAQVDGAWKTFPCLKHEEDTDCPFCEANQALRASGKEADKELAKKYSARKMYILKVVERGNEKEGVKFWRFNHAWDGGGTLDKIMGAVKAVKHDITDPKSGRDLILNIARNQFKVPIVQSVAYPLESTPLSEDDNEASVWANDTRTWRDVYSLRDYNYLKIVVSGEVPAWSKENDKWVSKSSLEAATIASSSQTEDDDSELTMGGVEPPKEVVTRVQDTNNLNPITPVVEVATPSPTVKIEDEDDDLPF
tara:strand:- start:14862 stop:15809 length:948 start_codon:yes stop_codon:yes gene_type:complete